MADEIALVITLQVAKGHISITRQLSKSITMSGNKFSWQTQSIGTTYEQLVIASDVATNGVAVFQNLDATNYVEIGVEVAAAFYPIARLNAGEAGTFRLAQGVAVFARANTAAVILEHQVLEN